MEKSIKKKKISPHLWFYQENIKKKKSNIIKLENDAFLNYLISIIKIKIYEISFK